MAKSKPEPEPKEPILEDVSVVEAAAEVDAVIEPALTPPAELPENDPPVFEDDFSREPSLEEALNVAVADIEEQVHSLKRACVQTQQIMLLIGREAEAQNDVAMQQKLFVITERLDRLNGI